MRIPFYIFKKKGEFCMKDKYVIAITKPTGCTIEVCINGQIYRQHWNRTNTDSKQTDNIDFADAPEVNDDLYDALKVLSMATYDIMKALE